MSLMNKLSGGGESIAQTAGSPGGIRRANAVEQLSTEQERLEKRLAQVKRGQEILTANPELLELLEILAERTY